MNKKYSILCFINIILPCAVCYVPNDTPLAQGTNNAVLFLLGIIIFILLNIIGTIFYFYYRSKNLNYGEQ